VLEGLMDAFTITIQATITGRPLEASMLDCRAGVKNPYPIKGRKSAPLKRAREEEVLALVRGGARPVRHVARSWADVRARSRAAFVGPAVGRAQ
jgi:hypothetical protein